MVNCGAAMYIAPVGAVNAGDPRRAYDEAIAFASGHQESYGLEAAAVLAAASIPWTLIVMLPTNTRLVEIGNKRGEEKFAGEVLQLLGKWSMYNAFRASAAFAGGVVGLATYAGLV